MTFTYGSVIRKLFKVSLNVNDSISRNANQSKKNKKNNQLNRKKRITKICVTLLLSFFICWSPFHIINMAMIAGIQISQHHVKTN